MIRTIAIAALAAAAAACAQAQTLERLARTGEVRIGVRTDAPPLSYTVDGVPFGYSVALCRRVAERIAEAGGFEAPRPVFVELGAAERFDAVADGRVDMLCGAASRTIERRRLVDFSIPVYVDGASVLLRRGEEVDFSGLAGKRIGARSATTTLDALRATLDGMAMEAEIHQFDDHEAAIEALLAGEIDAYFADQSILLFQMNETGRADELSLSRNTLTLEAQALALPRGDDEFRLAVDAALSRMHRSGETEAIFAEAFAPAEMGEGMRALLRIAPLRE